MLRDLGYVHWQEHSDHKLFFVIRRCHLEFYAPARVDDLVLIRTNLLQLERVKLIIRQEFWRGDDRLVDLEITLALVTQEGKPTSFPEKLQTLLKPLMENTDRDAA